MKSQFFDQKVFSRIEVPVQKLMELHVNTIKNLSYIKPEEMMQFKKPEEFIERNMNMFVQNSHKMFELMKDSFSVMEKHFFNVSHTVEESAKKVIMQSKESEQSSMKKSMPSVKSAVKKAAPKKAKKASPIKASPIKAAATSAKKKVAASKKVSAPKKMASAPKKVVIKKASPAMKQKPKQSMPVKDAMKRVEPKIIASPEKNMVKDMGLSITKPSHLPN